MRLNKVLRARDGIASLETMHEGMIRRGERAFAKHGKAPFLWWLLAADGILLEIESDWHDDLEKRQQVNLVAALAGFFGVTRYSFMTEAWLAVKTSRDGTFDRTRPEHDPEREDVLIVITRERERGPEQGLQTRFAVKYSSQRPDFGKLLARDDIVGWDDFGGWMSNLFENKLAQLDGAVEALEEVRQIHRERGLSEKEVVVQLVKEVIHAGHTEMALRAVLGREASMKLGEVLKAGRVH